MPVPATAPAAAPVTSPLEKMGIGGLPALGVQLQSAQDDNKSAMQDYERASKEKSGVLTQGAERLNTLRQQAPEQPNLQAIPDKFTPTGMGKEEMTENMQTMFALAAIGGLMTRKPMSLAIKAFTGGLQGLHAGDQQAYKRGLEEFDRNLKVATAKNSEAVQKYQLALEKNKGDLTAAMNEIQLAANAAGDTMTAAIARSGNAKAVIGQIQAMVKAEENATRTQQQFELQMKKIDQQIAAQNAAAARSEAVLNETIRHNQATESNTANRNATYAQRMDAAGKNGLKGKAADAFIHNQSNIEALQEVLGQLDENPDAFGFKTVMPGIFLNRFDPEGTPVRAGLANVTSMTIKDRAGTAQTASEMKNLAPFIPRDGDDSQTVRTKITGMIGQMERMNRNLSGGPVLPGAAPPAKPSTGAPQVGEKRTINGTPAHWDGKGWLPD